MNLRRIIIKGCAHMLTFCLLFLVMFAPFAVVWTILWSFIFGVNLPSGTYNLDLFPPGIRKTYEP